MKIPSWTYRACAAAALFFLAIFVVLLLLDRGGQTGPFLIGCFVLLSVAFHGFKTLKSYSYTMAIFAAVTVSLYYPRLFLKVGDFELKGLIVPLLQIIMFGMGAQLSIRDFAKVVKTPRGVFVGLACQFSIMPLVGFSLAKGFGFPPEIAAGIVLVGASPSGLASNVMAFIARANLALSVSMTLVATMLAPLMTPLFMKLLAGQFIPVDFWSMMLSIANLVILPIVAGLTFNLIAYGKDSRRGIIIQVVAYLLIILLKNWIFLATSDAGLADAGRSFLSDALWFTLLPIVAGFILHRTARGSKQVLDQVLALVSMIGIAVIITIITANGRDNLIQIGLLLILACLLHNLLGFSLGYLGCKLVGMNQTDCRTIALEVGLQNGGLASGIALEMGKVATVGLAPAVFGPLMNITGSSLATRWRAKPVTDGSAQLHDAGEETETTPAS